MRVLSTGNAPPPPDRRQGAHHPLTPWQNNNRRIYDEHAVRRLFYIRHARNLRFEVLEIATLLSLRETPRSHAARRIRSHTRLADVEARTDKLQILRAELKDMIDGCAQGKGFELSYYRGDR